MLEHSGMKYITQTIGHLKREVSKTNRSASKDSRTRLRGVCWLIPPRRVEWDLVVEAVQQDGLAIQYVSTIWRDDSGIVLKAVQQNGFAFKFIKMTKF